MQHVDNATTRHRDIRECSGSELRPVCLSGHTVWRSAVGGEFITVTQLRLLVARLDVDLLDRLVLRRVVWWHLWLGSAEDGQVGPGGPEASRKRTAGHRTRRGGRRRSQRRIAAGMFFSAISISVSTLRASARSSG